MKAVFVLDEVSIAGQGFEDPVRAGPKWAETAIPGVPHGGGWAWDVKDGGAAGESLGPAVQIRPSRCAAARVLRELLRRRRHWPLCALLFVQAKLDWGLKKGRCWLCFCRGMRPRIVREECRG